MKTQIDPNRTRQPGLTNAVISQLGGTDSLEDICRNGIDGGFSGFTYYADTVAFTEANLDAILERLKDDCDSMGLDSIAKVLASFRCLEGYSENELISAFIGRGHELRELVFNALAWYAAEEIARELNPNL